MNTALYHQEKFLDSSTGSVTQNWQVPSQIPPVKTNLRISTLSTMQGCSEG
jgi:hypothetical protein